MNTPPTSGGAPEWLRELATARTHYEELFGWPVVIEVQQRRLAAPLGGVLSAVTMPATLGEKVLTDLRLMLSAGPVATEPDEDRWVFFTQPVAGPHRDMPAQLEFPPVHFIAGGMYMAVPTQLDSDSALRWIEQPQPRRPLPSWSVLTDATLRVSSKLVSAQR